MPESTLFTQWIADVTAVVAAGALASALLVGVRQLKAASEANRSQVMAVYYDRWRRKALRDGRRLTAYASPEEMLARFQAAKADASEAYYLMTLVPEFFEDLALSIRYGAVGLNQVEAWIGSIAIQHWKRWRLVAEHQRVAEPRQPTAYANFEALAADIERVRSVRNSLHGDVHLLAGEVGQLGRPLQ